MHESERAVIVELLTALCETWSLHETPANIGSDIEKLRLMKMVANHLGTDTGVPDTVKDLYWEVFLRDVWCDRASG